MLAKLFGYRVELIEHSADFTLVKADTAVPVGTQIPVRVSGANGRRTPSVPMFVISCRESEHGGYILVGKFLVDHPDLSGLELPPSVSDSFARSSPRVSCHLCVLSRDLPGFRVMTVDISEGGLQVETPSEVAIGALVLLRLEFDTDRLPSIQASATVAWCTQQERGKYRVGLQFTSIDQASQDVISSYRELVARREQTDIQSRMLEEETVAPVLVSDVAVEAPPVPELNVLDWKRVPLQSGSTLVGYMRAGTQLQVRFRTNESGGRASEFVFMGLRAVRDNLDGDPTVREISDFRYATVNTDLHRFQLLDSERSVLMEIEAAACREGVPDAN